MIGRAGGESELARHELDALLRQYLPALKAHLVIKKRIESNLADDLLQEFITNKVLERDLLGAADPDRGRFRTLLATALDRFVANQWERRGAKKRSADRAASLDVPDTQRAAESTGGAADPSQPMVTEWARQLLHETIQQMEQECTENQRPDVWMVFQGRILGPIMENSEPETYDVLVKRCGFSSPAQASNALVTAKRMFARRLHAVISQYARNDQEVDAEIRELREILSS